MAKSNDDAGVGGAAAVVPDDEVLHISSTHSTDARRINCAHKRTIQDKGHESFFFMPLQLPTISAGVVWPRTTVGLGSPLSVFLFKRKQRGESEQKL